MIDLKPKIFIGSSTLGYAVAEDVKNFLNDVGDCHLWKENGVWEPNSSTFENLMRMVGYFDFGVFVATLDDLTLTNDTIVIEARDNVILEMALFLGAMGRDKSFLLVEEGIKLPSDFSGIYMPTFKRNEPVSIQDACETYAKKMLEHYQLGHLSLYPTTALAIGYYKNFISGLVDSIQSSEELEFEGTKYSEFSLKVVLPENLNGNIREKATLFYKRHGFIESSIKTKFRKHTAWFQLDPKAAPRAIMYDMPSTLTGIDESIEMVLQKGFQGRSKMQEVIEQRELTNFKRVLQIKIDSSSFAKACVEICDEF